MREHAATGARPGERSPLPEDLASLNGVLAGAFPTASTTSTTSTTWSTAATAPSSTAASSPAYRWVADVSSGWSAGS